MKRTLFFVIGMIVLASCNKTETGSFTITGKIKSPPNNMIYLEKLSYQGSDTKVVDSTKIGSDGSYTLSASDNQQNLYLISFKDNPSAILVNDAKDIHIDLDMNGYHDPQEAALMRPNSCMRLSGITGKRTR